MGKLFVQILFLILAFANMVQAQDLGDFVDITQKDPELDAFYQRGSYLVYDCLTKHWVCTQELEYKRCLNDRKEALLDFRDQLPCAYLDKFVSKKDCFLRQQELTDRAHNFQFCFHPARRENMFSF